MITRNRQIIFTLSIGLIALLLVLAQIAISRHKISCKNRKLFEQIEQLSRAKKELERIRMLMEENPAKQLRVSVKDKLYTRLEALMRERRLFLQPDLNREQVAAELGTNKLYLANAISEYADLTFTEYINRWRLDVGVSSMLGNCWQRIIPRRLKRLLKCVVLIRSVPFIGFSSRPIN